MEERCDFNFEAQHLTRPSAPLDWQRSPRRLRAGRYALPWPHLDRYVSFDIDSSL